MFQHFGQRLKRDLKQLVDRRLDAGVLASGSLKKVSSTFVLVLGRNSLSLFSLLVSMLMSSRTNGNGRLFAGALPAPHAN